MFIQSNVRFFCLIRYWFFYPGFHSYTFRCWIFDWHSIAILEDKCKDHPSSILESPCRQTWPGPSTSPTSVRHGQKTVIHQQLHQVPVDVRQKIVHTTILPKLEYCSAVQDPHQKQDITRLDSVQRFAGRMVLHSWTIGTDELLTTLARVDILKSLQEEHQTKGPLWHLE